MLLCYIMLLLCYVMFKRATGRPSRRETERVKQGEVWQEEGQRSRYRKRERERESEGESERKREKPRKRYRSSARLCCDCSDGLLVCMQFALGGTSCSQLTKLHPSLSLYLSISLPPFSLTLSLSPYSVFISFLLHDANVICCSSISLFLQNYKT